MKQDYIEIAREAMRRPLNADEISELRRHAQAVADAVPVAASYKANEREIIRQTVDRIFSQYTQKMSNYEQAREKVTRDMKLVLRYCVYGMLLDDAQWSNDQLFYWFRTILNAFDLNDGPVSDAYTWVQEAVTEIMGPTSARILNPRIEDARQVFIN